MLWSINGSSDATPVIPKVEEPEEILKFVDGCIWNTDGVFVIYTLQACRISLREREQIAKKNGFPNKEITMDFICPLFYLQVHTSGVISRLGGNQVN